VRELGASAAGQAGDVSSWSDTQAFVGATVERFGGVDVLFANAGTEGRVAPLLEQTEENFDRILGVNVKGVWHGIRAVVPHLQKRGGGSIVITSSIAGFIGSPGLGPYVTSKHGVMGLMKVAALELAPLKIRVNTLNPGPVDNRMMRSIEEQAAPGHGAEVKAGFEKAVPLGRYVTNEEMANMALFLASDASSAMTGTSMVGDGGYITQ
jgi:NAD(P)-dependent dehydrogenase (short-subunit alcohol dehydrogenase family)